MSLNSWGDFMAQQEQDGATNFLFRVREEIIRYERSGSTYVRPDKSGSAEAPRVLPVVEFNPLEIGSEDDLIYDAEHDVYRHKDAAIYYKKTEDGFVLKEGQLFVVLSEGSRTVPWEINNEGEIIRHYQRPIVDRAAVALVLAQNRHREASSSIVLPGFPLRGEAISMCIDAQAGIVEYQEIRYRHLLEDETSTFDTDDAVQAMYKNKGEQITSEINAYQSIVPSEALFAHFRETLIKHLEEKRSNNTLTEDEITVLNVLNNPEIDTFYEFAVATGQIEEIPTPQLLPSERGSAVASEYVKQLRDLQIAKVNTGFAMHYYMDQQGAAGLPSLNLSGYQANSAYEDIVNRRNRPGSSDDDFYKRWHNSNQKRMGEADAMLYIFSCIHRSPRWQDIAYFQEGLIPLSEYERRQSWQELHPNGNLPMYYGAPLDDYVSRRAALLPKNEREAAAQLPMGVRKYYYSHSFLEQSINAINTYRTAMRPAEGENAQTGRIPLYRMGSNSGNVHVNQIGLSNYYVSDENNIDNLLMGGAASAHRVDMDSSITVGSVDFATFVAATRIRTVGAIMTLGVGGFPGFIIGAAVGYAAHCTYSYVMNLVEEGKIQDAIGIVDETINDVNAQRIALSTRMEVLANCPEKDKALQYVCDELAKKRTRTKEEEALYQYLLAEIQDPTTEFSAASFDASSISNVSINGDVSDKQLLHQFEEKVREQAAAFDALAKVHGEASVYAYCLNTYYASQRARETDRTPYTTARDNAINNQATNRQASMTGAPSIHVTNSAHGEIPVSLTDVVQDPNSVQNAQELNSDVVLDRVRLRVGEYTYNPDTDRKVWVATDILKYENVRYEANQEVLREGYRARYTREAMRSLTKVWEGDPFRHDSGLIADQAGASKNVVLPHSVDGYGNAMFHTYSFATVRRVEISNIEKAYVRNNKDLTSDQWRLYHLLTARTIKKSANGYPSADDIQKYNNAVKKLQELAGVTDPNADPYYIERLRLERVALLKTVDVQDPSNPKFPDEVSKARYEALEAALKEYDDVTVLENTSYAKYQRAINPNNNMGGITVQAEVQEVVREMDSTGDVANYYARPNAVAWNQIRGDVQSMGEEAYDFLSSVQVYMLSEGATLKAPRVSRELVALFPSRAERKSRVSPDSEAALYLREEFQAEKNICDDILHIFETSMERSPELKAIATQKGWLGADGKLDLNKIYQDPQPQNQDIMHAADVAEKRCCYLLRAIESERLLNDQVNALMNMKDVDLYASLGVSEVSAVWPCFFDQEDRALECKKTVYQKLFDKLLQEADNNKDPVSLLSALHLYTEYGDAFDERKESNLKALQENFVSFINKSGFETYFANDNVRDDRKKAIFQKTFDTLLKWAEESNNPDLLLAAHQLYTLYGDSYSKDSEKENNLTKLQEQAEKLGVTLPVIETHRSEANSTTDGVAATLNENSEQNITTIQGSDGVAVSYQDTRGRA